jgi:hypothetical protein
MLTTYIHTYIYAYAHTYVRTRVHTYIPLAELSKECPASQEYDEDFYRKRV